MVKEEKREEKSTYTIEHYYCDLCGKEFVMDSRWHTREGGSAITIIDDEESYNYGFEGGGEEISISYDICTDCMKNTILKFIKQLCNKEPRDSTYEW